ncbi:MAG TPA: hypothetical protein VK815_00605 [Candidatus Acidoferrales bacterium]|nr:hypothetical protein [Candidatus Acidoferrales bacterium]
MCLLAQATTVFGLSFNVPIVSLTNHNTSACSNYNQAFTAVKANFGTTSVVDTSGDTIPIDPNKVDMSLNPVSPGHVSHVDVHTLIPNRPDLRWFANGCCWWGEGLSHHVDNGTTNTTAAYAAAMVNDLESRGFDGLIFSWYGIGDQTDVVAKNVQKYLNSTNNPNTNFTFTIMIVCGFFQGGEGSNNFVKSIKYCETNYFTDAHYEKEKGHPLLMFFNVYPAFITNSTEVNGIKAHTSANTYWVQEGTSYISDSWVDMTFLWTQDHNGPNTNWMATDPYNLVNVTNGDFQAIKSHPSKQGYAAMCARFNGTLTADPAWSLGKYLPSDYGLCEVERAATISQAISTNMTRMQWATWSDYEEGTEVELGVENNISLTTAVNGSILSWTNTSGDVRTVDHFDVYAATNGTAALLASVPSGTYQTNISQLGLNAGSYQLYVNAVGKPCMRDHLSPPVSYAEAQILPLPWSHQDVGSVGVSGSASYTNGIFTVGGSGTDIWGSHDGFQFVYQPWSGDGQIVVRVASVQNTAPFAKAAIMYRETLNDDSVNGLICVTPTSGVSMQCRTNTTGSTFTVQTTSGLTPPKWLSLVRLGNVLTGYESSDAMNWTAIGTNIVPMATNIYVGMAVTSKSNVLVNTSVFDHVAVSGPWLSQDIGAVGVAGGSQINYSNGAVIVSGSGFDIWGNGDEFQFLYQACSGDNAIIARVTGVEGTSPWAKAAVMIRETLATNSRNTILFLSPSNGVQLQGRTATGGSTVSVVNDTGLAAPQWLQLFRSGANMNAYISSDGINWDWVGTQSNSMASSYYIGLAVTSKDNTQLNTSIFDNVSIQNAWASEDIGSVGVPGSATVDNTTGTFTVSGSGADIWSTSDAFQFVGQPLYGNGQIVARVLSVQNTDPWAKAGVMIRDTEAANAMNALLFVAAASTNGVSFQGRSSTGGTSSTFLSVGGISAPYWIKLARSGSSLTAYRSGDGITWTQVGTAQTITMSANAVVGLAVCSKNNSVLNTSMFDNVTITPAP